MPSPPDLVGRATCGACGWSGVTRHAAVHEKHRCPKCGADKLTIVPLSSGAAEPNTESASQ